MEFNELKKMDMNTNIPSDIKVDIIIDEILNQDEVSTFFYECNKRNINPYSDEGYELLEPILQKHNQV